MATDAEYRAWTRPMSIQEITKEAGNFEYNPNTPLRYWLRAADAIQKQAESYERDGDEQNAYLFLLRHALLVFDKLPHHAEAKMPENRTALAKANKTVMGNLAKMEPLKPKIEQRQKRYLESVARRKTERDKAKAARSLAAQLDGAHLESVDPPDTALDGAPHALDARSNIELALRLARKESKSRGLAKDDKQQDRSLPVREWNELGKALSASSRQEAREKQPRPPIDTGRHGQRVVAPSNGVRSFGDTVTTLAMPHYPTVPHKSAYEVGGETSKGPILSSRAREPPAADALRAHDFIPGPLPPKIPLTERRQSRPLPPPLPDKVASSHLTEPVVRPASATSPQNDLNSRNYSFKPAAYLENGTPLRTIFIPPELRARFISTAAPNTRRNLETCGILCGRLISNAFFISKLVIPEQESTSDTCEMVNEGALAEYCEHEDLMQLGWIHTHPTQTCFMSSRDLHTHSLYQMQFAESIAIVCAPSKDPSWGVFRLTDPPGLKAILDCSQPGIFHPHAEANVYTDASRPGHVCELAGLDFELVDLRPGKG